MFDTYIFYILIFFLTAIQSIIGVGVLVLGTPILLIFKINFIDILAFLLPTSIVTSLINYIYFNSKNMIKFKIDKYTLKIFFLGTIPSIFIGLMLLKNFEIYINFKYLVSGVIIISILLVNQKNIFYKVNRSVKFIFLIIVGIIHGLSNSGGSLLSIFFTALNKKNESRYYITFFYFFLALTQYIFFIRIFNQSIMINTSPYLFFSIIAGCIFGNYIIRLIKQSVFKMCINILAITACVALLTIK